MKAFYTKSTINYSILVFVFFLLISFNAKSQTLLPQIESENVETVFSTLKIDYQTFNDIDSKLRSLKKIEYIGYCTNHEIFIIKASSVDFSSSKELFDFITNKFAKPDLFIKKEGTYAGIIDFCEFKGVNSPEAEAEKKALLAH